MHPRSRSAAAVVAALLLSALPPFAPAGAQPNRQPSGTMKAELQPPRTLFTVTATDPDGDDLTYKWTADLACGTFQPNSPTEHEAIWNHPAGEPPEECPHEEGRDHQGVVRVIVTDPGGLGIQCTHEGSGDGEHDCNVYGEDLSDCIMNLKLSDAQGGRVLGDEEEETRGAFTVVNRNDSDGAGGVDLRQATVSGEKDLIRVRMEKPEPSAGGIVTLHFPSNMSIYATANKGRRLDVGAPLDFNVGELPKNVWAEGTAASSTVRDGKFKADYRPTGTNPACTDEGKSTVIDAEIVSVLHDASDTLWLDLPSPPANGLQQVCGGGVGLRPIGPSPRGVRNCIAFRFEIVPNDIVEEGDIVFDVSRQKSSETYIKLPRDDRKHDFAQSRFPEKERANDDGNDNDESEAPTASGMMFSFDGPGTRTNESGTSVRARFFYEATFREFLRVNYDGSRPTGNVEAGTRVGPWVRWSAQHALITGRSRVWRRIGGDDPETEKNRVER